MKRTRKNQIKKSISEKMFDAANIFIMCLIILVTIYPFLFVLFGSLSSSAALLKHSGLLFHPLGFSINGYITSFKNPLLLTGFRNTLIILLGGTALNMVVTTLGAYALSRKGPMLNGLIMKLCVFTMFFSGGIIPTYLLVRNLNLLDSLAALILPGTVSTTNMIIMRTSFAAIPDSLPESARIDGANELTILLRIVVPLSLATIAVISLYYGVAHWNSWFNASIYLQTRTLFPVQLVLREVLISDTTDAMLVMSDSAQKYAEGDVLKYSMIIIATVPVVLIYPFIQRFFAKGVMIGAIKS